jgi:hypothetical protein
MFLSPPTRLVHLPHRPAGTSEVYHVVRYLVNTMESVKLPSEAASPIGVTRGVSRPCLALPLLRQCKTCCRLLPPCARSGESPASGRADHTTPALVNHHQATRSRPKGCHLCMWKPTCKVFSAAVMQGTGPERARRARRARECGIGAITVLQDSPQGSSLSSLTSARGRDARVADNVWSMAEIQRR